MKFNRNTQFYIAKNVMDSVFTKNQPLEYDRWVEFVDKHQDHFIWNENTKSGIETLANMDKIPDSFKERVLRSLNKGGCYKEFDVKKGFYNINVGFNPVSHWVSIGFERTPKLEDLKIFVEMAKHLDALLLKEGKIIIDEKMIESLT